MACSDGLPWSPLNIAHRDSMSAWGNLRKFVSQLFLLLGVRFGFQLGPNLKLNRTVCLQAREELYLPGKNFIDAWGRTLLTKEELY